MDDEEQEVTTGTTGADEDSEEGDKTDAFLTKWKWQHLVDTVSEIMRIDWHKAYGLNITEFLNIVCYANDKIGYNNEQMKRWQRMN